MKTTPKDFFLNLGATVVLYASAIALVNLLFSVIDYFFPDILAGNFYVSSVAWPISMLIVLVPILYILEWVIARDIRNIPEKAEIWICKWRIYLTLFLGGIAIVGDLIVLINIYLNGEIGTRFVYKVLAVLIISGVIFFYYFLERNTAVNRKIVQKILVWFGIIFVVFSIVLGFVSVGSPAKQRALRFDNQRISDLSTIQWQIVNHWQQKGKLPSALSLLNDSISGFVLPNDPETKESYEYSVKNNTSFQLCGVFSLVSKDVRGKGSYGGVYDYAYPVINSGENWNHTAGRVCFDRTIDPERYPKHL